MDWEKLYLQCLSKIGEKEELREEDECGVDTWQMFKRVKEGDMALIPCWNWGCKRAWTM